MAKYSEHDLSGRRSLLCLFRKKSKTKAGDHQTEPRHVVKLPPNDILDQAEAPSRTSLFVLPAELQIQILNHLPFETLLSFRQTNRQSFNLLQTGDLSREWMLHSPYNVSNPRGSSSLDRRKVIHLYTRLYPLPIPFTFTYLMEHRRRIHMAIVCARAIDWFIGDYILMNPHLWPESSQGWFHNFPVEMLPPEYADVRKQMAPLLLTLQHYLENMRDLYAAPPPTLDGAAAIRHHFRVREKNILTNGTYSIKHLHNTHKMFLVLCWLTKKMFDPASHRARRLNVFSTKPSLRDEETRQFVLFAGLPGLKKILAMSSYRGRRRCIQTFLRSMNPEKNRQGWQQTRTNVSLRYCHPSAPPPSSTEKKSYTRALHFTSTLSWQDVWIGAARSILIEKGILAKTQAPMTAQGVPRRTLEWTTDIAGYHGSQLRYSGSPPGTHGQVQQTHNETEIYEDEAHDNDNEDDNDDFLDRKCESEGQRTRMRESMVEATSRGHY